MADNEDRLLRCRLS